MHYSVRHMPELKLCLLQLEHGKHRCHMLRIWHNLCAFMVQMVHVTTAFYSCCAMRWVGLITPANVDLLS